MNQNSRVVVKSATQQRTLVAVPREWLAQFTSSELRISTTASLQGFVEATSKPAKLECELDYNTGEEEEL